MKLDRLTVMAEIIGAVAIVVTLVILIFEVRGNTEELRAATISNIAGRTQEVNLLKVRNLQFAEVMTRLDAGDELSPAESFQVIDYLLAVLKVAEESFISHRAGSLDEDIWLTRASAAVGHLQDEQSRAMYIRIRDRGSLTPDFTDWLDVTLIERYGK